VIPLFLRAQPTSEAYKVETQTEEQLRACAQGNLFSS
jgi:hypothetical protein